MLLGANGIQLYPFEKSDSFYLWSWFFNKKYSEMWRNHPRIFTPQEFERFPEVIGAEVYMVRIEGHDKPIGYVQLQADTGRTNRAVFVGLLLEKEYQGQGHAATVIALVLDYAFNRLGFRKVIVEILESNVELKKTIVKAGFLLEGRLFGNTFYKGEFVDELRFSMSAAFFNKKYKQMVDAWE